MIKLVATVAVAAFAAISVVGSSGPAAAAVGDSCSIRFPETEWVTVRSGGVSIEVTGMTPALATRFDEEISLIDGWISDDIGPYSVTVCLVSGESAFDSRRYEGGSRRFHAHSDLPDQLLVLNVERIGFVAPAAAYALAQHALWQHNGNEGFPEPIASVIGQWYRARILQRLDQYHRDVMFSNLFDTESIIDWTSSIQKPVQDWDPETNFAPIGDFMDFAVETHGTEVLRETDGERWSQIEGEWRVSLRNDLRGRDSDTTGWIGGVALTTGSVLVASIAITLGLIAKYRRKRRRETPPPIPGFFSES
ncbi:MAG: hypothetical protein BMS9Abin12_1815 [Acidimicrobiia bacterium]|nr:MAG: hypothetical protein BMS9Abin12_1815 [Acidimicrobiia bacterium]